MTRDTKRDYLIVNTELRKSIRDKGLREVYTCVEERDVKRPVVVIF